MSDKIGPQLTPSSCVSIDLECIMSDITLYRFVSHHFQGCVYNILCETYDCDIILEACPILRHIWKYSMNERVKEGEIELHVEVLAVNKSVCTRLLPQGSFDTHSGACICVCKCHCVCVWVV